MGDFVSQPQGSRSRWPELAPDHFAHAPRKAKQPRARKVEPVVAGTPEERESPKVLEIVDIDDYAMPDVAAPDVAVAGQAARTLATYDSNLKARPAAPHTEVTPAPEPEAESQGTELPPQKDKHPHGIGNVVAFPMRVARRLSQKSGRPHVEPDIDATEGSPPVAKPRTKVMPHLIRASQATGAVAAFAWRKTRAASKRVDRSWKSWLASKFSTRPDELAILAEDARNTTVANRLRSAAVLSEAEEQAVHAASSAVRRTYQASTEIAIQGEITPRPMFIASGWACRCRVLSDGRRQVLGFLLPGDGIGLRGCAEPLAPTTILALTTVETVDATPLLRLAEQPQRHPGIAHAMQRAAVQEEEFLINQVFRLGVLNAVERLAHLVMELQWRLAAAGLATPRELAMPLTYETIGEALSLNVKRVAGAFRALDR